jgi:hypothetical protein
MKAEGEFGNTRLIVLRIAKRLDQPAGSVPTHSTSGAGAARHTGLVSRTLPEPIAEQVLAFPEWRMGAQRIKVTLADGRTFAPVDVAWGREIVRVADDEEVPFDAEDVVHVEDQSDG